MKKLLEGIVSVCMIFGAVSITVNAEGEGPYGSDEITEETESSASPSSTIEATDSTEIVDNIAEDTSDSKTTGESITQQTPLPSSSDETDSNTIAEEATVYPEMMLASGDDTSTKKHIIVSEVGTPYNSIFYLSVGMSDEEVAGRVNLNSTLAVKATLEVLDSNGTVLETDGPMYIQLAAIWKYPTDFSTAQAGIFEIESELGTSNLYGDWKNATISLGEGLKTPSATVKVITEKMATATQVIYPLNFKYTPTNITGKVFMTYSSEAGIAFNKSVFNYTIDQVLENIKDYTVTISNHNNLTGYSIYAQLNDDTENRVKIYLPDANNSYLNTADILLPATDEASQVLHIIVINDTDSNDTCTYNFTILRKKTYSTDSTIEIDASGKPVVSSLDANKCSYSTDTDTLIINSGSIPYINSDTPVTSTVINNGVITSGVFTGNITNNGTISDGTFASKITNNGTIEGGAYTVDQSLPDGVEAYKLTLVSATVAGTILTEVKAIHGSNIKLKSNDVEDKAFNNFLFNPDTYVNNNFSSFSMTQTMPAHDLTMTAQYIDVGAITVTIDGVSANYSDMNLASNAISNLSGTADITINSDVSGCLTVPSTATVNLDLGVHTMKNSDTAIYNYGDLKITGSEGAKIFGEGSLNSYGFELITNTLGAELSMTGTVRITTDNGMVNLINNSSSYYTFRTYRNKNKLGVITLGSADENSNITITGCSNSVLINNDGIMSLYKGVVIQGKEYNSFSGWIENGYPYPFSKTQNSLSRTFTDYGATYEYATLINSDYGSYSFTTTENGAVAKGVTLLDRFWGKETHSVIMAASTDDKTADVAAAMKSAEISLADNVSQATGLNAVAENQDTLTASSGEEVQTYLQLEVKDAEVAADDSGSIQSITYDITAYGDKFAVTDTTSELITTTSVEVACSGKELMMTLPLPEGFDAEIGSYVNILHTLHDGSTVTVVGQIVEKEGITDTKFVTFANSDGFSTIQIESTSLTASVSGTVTSRNNIEDIAVGLYSADATDTDIRTDIKLNSPISAVKLAVLDKPAQNQSNTAKYDVSYSLMGVQPASYKLAVYKHGYGVTIQEVTVSADVILSYDLLILGDLNNNGSVTTADVLIMRKAATNRITLTNMQKVAADVNENGMVTSSDVLWIRQRVLNRRNEYFELMR